MIRGFSKDAKPASPADFMPYFEKQEKPQPTTQQKAMLDAAAALFGKVPQRG